MSKRVSMSDSESVRVSERVIEQEEIIEGL